MEDCSTMHICWTLGPLHRQKLILAIAKAKPIWDYLYCGRTSNAQLAHKAYCLKVRKVHDYTEEVLVLERFTFSVDIL